MVMRNERVEGILDLVQRFKICDVTHVTRLFYGRSKASIFNARKKLSALVDEGTLKRKRSDINAKYCYWLVGEKEPSQIQHKLLLLELYVRLCERFGSENVECIPEYTRLSGIRPDAFIAVQNKSRTYLYFAEIQIASTPLDLTKYEKAYLTNKEEKVFPEGIFPTILAVTDQKIINKTRLNLVTLDTKLSNINKIGGV